MDDMYIIKSGDLVYTHRVSCGIHNSGFSKGSLITAHKMSKLATAEAMLTGLRRWAEGNVDTSIEAEGDSKWNNSARQTLALWEAARIVKIKLVEA